MVKIEGKISWLLLSFIRPSSIHVILYPWPPRHHQGYFHTQHTSSRAIEDIIRLVDLHISVSRKVKKLHDPRSICDYSTVAIHGSWLKTGHFKKKYFGGIFMPSLQTVERWQETRVRDATKSPAGLKQETLWFMVGILTPKPQGCPIRSLFYKYLGIHIDSACSCAHIPQQVPFLSKLTESILYLMVSLATHKFKTQILSLVKMAGTIIGMPKHHTPKTFQSSPLFDRPLGFYLTLLKICQKRNNN